MLLRRTSHKEEDAGITDQTTQRQRHADSSFTEVSQLQPVHVRSNCRGKSTQVFVFSSASLHLQICVVTIMTFERSVCLWVDDVNSDSCVEEHCGIFERFVSFCLMDCFFYHIMWHILDIEFKWPWPELGALPKLYAFVFLTFYLFFLNLFFF